ncbi:hypothetical protein TWF225_003960 [Orbilia oligospora]|nr:hypothetical protein TWF751_001163 [Orbilia oligospora]KAF3160181.1 hypothetical protein TWF225_003960 [Orbilia oligospora]KAF3231711.1 hypothetical protein TWF128_004642 [Orbilia oligospora]KAF3236699.1 hypothetical protein TWF217_002494 [Orbilia oligospora]KAF3294312.1 hypothetical protein TWF132_003734 [Orbilia oligospora]
MKEEARGGFFFFFSWEVQAAQAKGREHMAPMEAVREIKDNGTGNIIGVRGVVSTRVAYIRGACSGIILEPVRERYIHSTLLVRRAGGWPVGDGPLGGRKGL